MDCFDDLEKKQKNLEKDQKEKEVFITNLKRQNELATKIITIVFGVICGIFSIMAAVLLIVHATSEHSDPDMLTGIYVMVGTAAFFLLLCFLFIFLGKTYNYEKEWEKYKKRVEKGTWGIYASGTYDLRSNLALLNAKVEELEKENEELKERVRCLEQK